MPLTIAKLNLSLQWQQELDITSFNSSSQSGPLAVTIAPTVGASAAREVYFVQGTLAAAAAVTIDLRAVTEPGFNRALTPTGAYIVLVKGAGATWRYDPGAANPLAWFLGGTTPQVNGEAGAAFSYGSPTATTINATNRNVRITNTHGSDVLTYTIAVVLKTA